MIPKIKKILYVTDLTKNSAYAFFYATDIAKRYNAKIIIIHSIENICYAYDDGRGSFQVGEILATAKKQDRNTDIEEIKKGIQEFCKRTDTQMGGPCVELVSKIIIPLGNPVEEILKAADEENCDAIVLGTHGMGFLRQTFLESVVGSVLQRTRKPVFVIPLPSEKTNIDWDKF